MYPGHVFTHFVLKTLLNTFLTYKLDLHASGFPMEILNAFLISSFVISMAYISSSFGVITNNNRQKVQITKLLITGLHTLFSMLLLPVLP
jgi:glutamate mutase epsilon subunit